MRSRMLSKIVYYISAERLPVVMQRQLCYHKTEVCVVQNIIFNVFNDNMLIARC